MTAPRYSYNARSARYHDNVNGQFVSAQTVRAGVDAVISDQATAIRAVAQRLVNGEINLAEWQIQTAAIVKQAHVAVGLAANGGLENISASDLGWLANRVKGQYQYLRSFAKQIKNGRQPLDGSLVARSELYVQSARGTYEDAIRRIADQGGATQERRVLGPADHCSGCLALAAQGWQPIGTLPGIGEGTPCLGNCRCSFQTR